MQIQGATRNRKTEHERCQTSLNIGSIRYEETYQKVYSSEDMNWRGHNTKLVAAVGSENPRHPLNRKINSYSRINTGGSERDKFRPAAKRKRKEPDAPTPLVYGVLMSLMAYTHVVLNNISSRKRPFVPVELGGQQFEALYDTGADVSCISEIEFRRIPIGERPTKAHPSYGTRFHGAAGGELNVVGMYEIPLRILGQTVTHPLYVIRNLKEKMIIGADLIKKYRLTYCPTRNEVFWPGGQRWALGQVFTHGSIHLDPFSVKNVKVQLRTEDRAIPEARTAIMVNLIHHEIPYLQGGPALIHADALGQATVRMTNCGPEPITLERNSNIGVIENIQHCEVTSISPAVLNAAAESAYAERRLAKISNAKEKLIKQTANLKGVPAEYHQKYLEILMRHHEAFSEDKHDIGRATILQHEIHLKNPNPVYVKQFKIADAHKDYLEDQVKEWLKMGIIEPTLSRYNSPMFLVNKKDGGYRVVQDFRALNAHSHVDKYSMKDVTECIGEIGRSHSTIFSTLDLTSGFWQMTLHPKSRPYTAFTVPGMGQFQWITSAMGLLGCLATFQRLVEAVMHGIQNVLVYIDDLILHAKTHEEHLTTLDNVLRRLVAHNLKCKLEKCVFGSKDVMYLGFHLTEEGIKPGKDKLRTVAEAKPPSNVKEVTVFGAVQLL